MGRCDGRGGGVRGVERCDGYDGGVRRCGKVCQEM